MHPMLAAEKTPDKPAVIMAATGETVTFQELEDRSNQAAQLFRALGLETGDGITIFMENNARYHEICWAAQRSGLYFTAISSRLTAGEATFVLPTTVERQFEVVDAAIFEWDWIPIGRDHELEQVILERIARLDISTPAH